MGIRVPTFTKKQREGSYKQNRTRACEGSRLSDKERTLAGRRKRKDQWARMLPPLVLVAVGNVETKR